jgi:predicted ribosomally synthesized peptide with SipW-like signal peptide
MKNIVLSVVVVAALMAAGIGGTLADFSDSEEEMGDVLQAGSLDLKVNGADDPDVLPFYDQDHDS